MAVSAKSMSMVDRIVSILIDGMSVKPTLEYHAKTDRFHGMPDDGEVKTFENNNIFSLANEGYAQNTSSNNQYPDLPVDVEEELKKENGLPTKSLLGRHVFVTIIFSAKTKTTKKYISSLLLNICDI
ncbi:uncharacterized protein LOC131439202 [Malaya genurostris]|uniref:uncharacterized protein LOC131439202 n=1 Tax=Malaya genurostris TaxID=325434 RepID=UPI0026F3DA6A|nr:uncharacterized protein LOC131439202 [Malaya genurostris]